FASGLPPPSRPGHGQSGDLSTALRRPAGGACLDRLVAARRRRGSGFLANLRAGSTMGESAFLHGHTGVVPAGCCAVHPPRVWDVSSTAPRVGAVWPGTGGMADWRAT